MVGLLIQFQWVGSLQVTLVKKDSLSQPPNVCHPPPAFFQSKIIIEFVQPIFLSPEEERVFVSLSLRTPNTFEIFFTTRCCHSDSLVWHIK